MLNLTISNLSITEFIGEKCTLQKNEVKIIFENYKFITNIKYMINKNKVESLDNVYSSNFLDNGIYKILFFNCIFSL